jgi:hypothetical protein
MHSLDDIYAIIRAAEKSEAKGEYLRAYQTYRMAIDAVDNDDDSFPYAGINPAPYDAAQYRAIRCCERLWNLLTDEEKAFLDGR